MSKNAAVSVSLLLGAALLMPNGKAPSTGEVFRNPDMAGVLRELGTGGKEAFYGGRIGEAMVEVLQKMGGVLTMEDLKARPDDHKILSMFFSQGHD